MLRIRLALLDLMHVSTTWRKPIEPLIRVASAGMLTTLLGCVGLLPGPGHQAGHDGDPMETNSPPELFKDQQVQRRFLEAANADGTATEVAYRRAFIQTDWKLERDRRTGALESRFRYAFVGGPLVSNPSECRYYRYTAAQAYIGPGEWGTVQVFRTTCRDRPGLAA